MEEYKGTHPCVDCGKTDVRFLTYDHVKGVKKKAISDMVNLGYTIESIQAELEECEVRCLECHHLRHHQCIAASKGNAMINIGYDGRMSFDTPNSSGSF